MDKRRAVEIYRLARANPDVRHEDALHTLANIAESKAVEAVAKMLEETQQKELRYASTDAVAATEVHTMLSDFAGELAIKVRAMKTSANKSWDALADVKIERDEARAAARARRILERLGGAR